MVIPDAVFLDTNVFDRQHFNFSGLALTAFVEACKRHGIPLLLPDPIERELVRHVRKLAADAVDLGVKARRTAPFLSRPRTDEQSLKAEAQEALRRADDALSTFLRQLTVNRLGYEGVDLHEVMDWYDSQTPPFGVGAKRKEFPDALALAIVGAYSKKNNRYIAVVSDDKDVYLACARYTKLSHFNELSALTEALINDQAQMDEFKAVIDSDPVDLEAQIAAAAAELPFHHCYRDYDLRSSKVLEARLVSARVVALGHDECTVTFVADVDGEHELEWSEHDTPEGDVEMSEELVETASVTGLAKIQVDRAAKRVKSVVTVELDQRVLLVTENPTAYL